MQRMDVFESNTSTALQRIEEQTKKTNGSVASLKIWRAYLTGATAVVLLVILPILAWSLVQVIANTTRISSLQSQIKTQTPK
jgi:hypothetical protein